MLLLSLHGTASSLHQYACTTILSPSPQRVSPPYHPTYQCAVAMPAAAVNRGRSRDALYRGWSR
jgi:hypothetical protein